MARHTSGRGVQPGFLTWLALVLLGKRRRRVVACACLHRLLRFFLRPTTVRLRDLHLNVTLTVLRSFAHPNGLLPTSVNSRRRLETSVNDRTFLANHRQTIKLPKIARLKPESVSAAILAELLKENREKG